MAAKAAKAFTTLMGAAAAAVAASGSNTITTSCAKVSLPFELKFISKSYYELKFRSLREEERERLNFIRRRNGEVSERRGEGGERRKPAVNCGFRRRGA